MTERTPDPDAYAVLAALLRARPATRAELPGVVHRGETELEAALAQLEDRGFLSFDGDAVRLADPEVVLAALAAESLERQRSELDVNRQLWQLVPHLVADARIGAQGVAPRPASEVVHGPEGQWQLWMRLMTEAPPRRPIAVFPELPLLASVVIAGGDDLSAHRARLGFDTRAIVRSAALAEPATREAIQGMRALGAEVRSLPEVPGWFYADAGVLAALPVHWGEPAPTSLLLVRDPAIVEPIASYAESLWSAARPLPGEQPGWEPVLELLAQGLSDGEIAVALDLSMRTVRRRVAEAAEELGAESRFALGVAWAREH
ncbi:LuxR C-terminal-related transcriptional regulator [Protaetiibacter mangrovi]|uniref:LuxR C-terminal-related transcriptional regulator n=1 Tax=Protaetiibacter mangrovi TaxID=2970926 RepID=A0ABT1ZHK3_9MICO|nr:LuxR C-terminal-related transcriptional regulator [Protaetiibacter mangrovi]MCS0500194.1 LuxR C-terminal-related transcriptional regulator [Protaetiibacter mangrovi]TPX02418.1 hypothetical protein FJ656_22485 [Schumannella luteola]